MTSQTTRSRRPAIRPAYDIYNELQADLQHALRTRPPLRTPDFGPFEEGLAGLTAGRAAELEAALRDATILDMQRLMGQGALSALELALFFVARIRRYDVGQLRSVVELNPDAPAIAAALDGERRAGALRGPLHGIPVLIKDNIGTGDRMHTTAGAAVLLEARCDRDAFIAARLRAAGAVILGKTNMSEWANYMSDRSSNGFSAVGGQTRTPYGHFDVGGSSSGSGAAVAARLAAAAVGTETYGSIISPAASNSLVGHKPTHGLVSRDRIIPITDATDTAGPLARSAVDAALLLAALAGEDAADAATAGVAGGVALPRAEELDGRWLEGRRVGWLLPDPHRSGDAAVRRRALAALRAAGATVVEVPFPAPRVEFEPIMRHGIKHGVAAYLEATAAPVHSLEEVIAFNRRDMRARALRGQALLEGAAAETLDRAGYEELVQRNRASSLAALRGALAGQGLDLLMTFNTFAAFNMAGVPILSMPAGYLPSGEPVGLQLAADLGRDGDLLAAGRAFELAARARREP